jgi:chromosome segregation ATPase
MSFLSVILRVLAIIAAAVSLIVFVQGGNQLKKLKSELERERSSVRIKTEELEQQSQKFAEIKESLDKTTLELATMKRDERLRKNETLLARQELDQVKSQLEQSEANKLKMADLNEALRRENIDLKAMSFDSSLDPRRLQDKVDSQLAEIGQLEKELKDSQTVIAALLTDQPSSVRSYATKTTRIQRVVPEHQLLVIEAGSNDGILPNAEFAIVRQGNVIAKVKVARVTSELSVVNIIEAIEGTSSLRQGTQIEYVL